MQPEVTQFQHLNWFTWLLSCCWMSGHTCFTSSSYTPYTELFHAMEFVCNKAWFPTWVLSAELLNGVQWARSVFGHLWTPPVHFSTPSPGHSLNLIMISGHPNTAKACTGHNIVILCYTIQPITEWGDTLPVKDLRVQRCSDHPSDQRNTCQLLYVLQRDGFASSTGENNSSDVSWIVQVDFSYFCDGIVLMTVLLQRSLTVFVYFCGHFCCKSISFSQSYRI